MGRGPDFHRLAVMNLSLGYAVLLILSLWRPNCWTHEGCTYPVSCRVPVVLMDQAAETITTTRRRRAFVAGRRRRVTGDFRVARVRLAMADC